jgi:dicarboxylate transporter 10
MEVLMQSLRNEGVGILFRGWVPAFMRLGPNTIVLFVTLEVGSFPCRPFWLRSI